MIKSAKRFLKLLIYFHKNYFQDGSYLAELLLSKGYKVHGIIRRSSSFNTARIEHLYSNPVTHYGDQNFKLHYGDMTDSSCLIKLISQIQPTEVYHLAAQSHVKVSLLQVLFYFR